MDRAPHNQHQSRFFRAIGGLLTAMVCAGLLIGIFVLETTAIPMPATERWAALTAFGLLALAYAMQGSASLYDGLGQVVRRDLRALLMLVALLPALYASYSVAVGEFTWNGLLIALIFVALPTVAFVRNRGQRTPTITDAVAILYLWLSVEFHLFPTLYLPQQGGLIGFFHFGAIPLLLLLLAARGWPGLGFTWFLSWRDLGTALLAFAVLLVLLLPLALASGFATPTVQIPSALTLFGRAVQLYFFVAVPAEIFFRGVIQNGIERTLLNARRHTRARIGITAQSQTIAAPNRFIAVWHWISTPRHASLILAALLFGLTYLNTSVMAGHSVVLATIAGLAYGWTYQQTGKVTAAAVVHMLVDWCWSIFFMVQ